MLGRVVTYAALCASMVSADSTPVGYNIIDNYSMTLLKKPNTGKSQLFQMDIPEIDNAYFLDVYGNSRYEMGYDIGYLAGDKIVGCMKAFMDWLSGGIPALNYVVEQLLLWQWDIALSKQTPQKFLEEMAGMSAGGLAAGIHDRDVGHLVAMGVVIANVPLDPKDFMRILIVEMPFKLRSELEAHLKSHGLDWTLEEALEKIRWLKPGCSNFGAWGSRTQGGDLFSGRNLDYTADTGINSYKLVTVYHPPDGFAHATLGFAGLMGALTGMSSQGITVHQANLESIKDTFYGFPWLLRLRDIMERATSIAEAQEIWLEANNTVGVNNAVGSTNEESGNPKWTAFETDAAHTAMFFDMDEREINGGGDPRPEALYRTNHGYDPVTVANYAYNDTDTYTNSLYRYYLFPQLFDAVAPGNYGILDAINTAAVLGKKGADYWQCGGLGTYADAENVLSVAFAPAQGIAYSAWEVGTGTTWQPACCASYVKIDFSQWW